ncbi:MAG: 50S ribosomal protein L35ae [Desulfurococcaceae archaeon]
MGQTCMGLILGYRRGSNTQYPGQVLVSAPIDRKGIYSLVGTKVVARDEYGNVYVGRVIKVLGSRNPKLVVAFRGGIPGQLIGRPVIVEKCVLR